MYGKIFAQIYDGSLYGHWQALVAFQQMIVLADQDGVVDMTPEALSARTSIPLEIIRAGIADLEQPDPDSRTPGEDGRRIVRLSEHRSWGWRITNYGAYSQLKSAEERRTYMRQYMRERRGNGKQPLAHGKTDSAQLSHIAVTGDVTRTVGTSEEDPRFEEFWAAYPRRAGGNPKKDALRCWNARVKESGEELIAVMIEGARRYAAFVTATEKDGTEFVMQAKRFLGPARPFADDWTLPAAARTARPGAGEQTYQAAVGALDGP